MALPFPISASQTDAKSPVDDNLMDSIRLDLEYLDSLFATGAAIFTWNVNGPLIRARGFRKALDTVPVFGEFQPGFVRVNLKRSGTSGNFRFDIRRHTSPKTPIIGIDHQYEGATTSIAQVAPALATQNITRATSQILTQSITVAKGTLSIQSIINLRPNVWRYNLSSAPDADWVIGRSILISGASNAANNGTFILREVNNSGFPSVVIENASGVAQTTAAGSVQLQLFSYNYSNPVSTQFVAGELVTMASHTAGANNGQFEIAKINSGGNNIWIWNPTGVVQGTAVGTADTNRWKYGLLSPASTTDFVVGERALMASHTTPANNGNFRITAVNLDTSNVTVYNPAGVVQGGVAGTINTNRWIYSLPTDPTSQVNVGDFLQLEGHTNAANNGIFDVRQVRRLLANNLVIYNEAGVVQGGSAGFVRTTRKVVRFSSNQAANYTALTSSVEIVGCPEGRYNYRPNQQAFQVLEVNRGGGSNFNIVIDVPLAASQPSPAGYVMIESKSIFTSIPSVAVDTTSLEQNQFIVASFTNIVPGLIPANTALGLYLIDVPLGGCEDLTVTLH